MKKFKKLMAALLVALMALAVIPAGAFAATVDWFPSGNKTLTDNGGTTQTFTYTVTAVDAKGLGTNDAPSIDGLSGTGTVTVAPGAKEAIDFSTITLPGDGYYEFEITEDEHSGYECMSTKTYYAIVSVIGGEVASTSYTTTKVDLSSVATESDVTTNDDGTPGSVAVPGETKYTSADFTNQMATGYNFTVTKEIAGTASNASDTFTFTVSADLSAGTSANITLTHGDTTTVVGKLDGNTKEVTVSGVKAGDIIASTALPENTVVTVKESDTGGYTSSWTNDTQEITIAKAQQDFTITNTKNAGTITGFVMHYTPYIALVVVAGLAVTLIAKRRHHSEF